MGFFGLPVRIFTQDGYTIGRRVAQGHHSITHQSHSICIDVRLNRQYLSLGKDFARAQEALGVQRIPVVKGQSISAWEPRVLKATGVTYATSPMGADHTCGNALPSMGYDPHVPEGQAKKSLDMQKYWAGIDTLGMCLFPSLAIDAKVMLGKKLVEAVGAVLGEDLSQDYLRELGGEVLAVEVDFNRRAGFTRKDDRLPTFMVEEAVPPSGYSFDVSEEDIDGVFP